MRADGWHRRVTCLWLSTQPSLDGYMLSTRRENDTITLERLGNRETVNLQVRREVAFQRNCPCDQKG